MPSSKFIKKITVPHSFRNEKVKGMFDVDKNEIIKNFDVNIPIENIKWNVGVIIGASGTGKTTIAKEVFKDYKLFSGFEWDNTKTIIDNQKEDMKIVLRSCFQLFRKREKKYPNLIKEVMDMAYKLKEDQCLVCIRLVKNIIDYKYKE